MKIQNEAFKNIGLVVGGKLVTGDDKGTVDLPKAQAETLLATPGWHPPVVEPELAPAPAPAPEPEPELRTPRDTPEPEAEAESPEEPAAAPAEETPAEAPEEEPSEPTEAPVVGNKPTKKKRQPS